jgi:hypothetical protein
VADAAANPPPELCEEPLTKDSFSVACARETDGPAVVGAAVPLRLHVRYHGTCPLLQIYPRATSELYFRVEPCPGTEQEPIPASLEQERQKWNQTLEAGLPVAEPGHGIDAFTRGTVFAGDSLTTEAVYRSHVHARYLVGTRMVIDQMVFPDEAAKRRAPPGTMAEAFAEAASRWYRHAHDGHGWRRSGLALVERDLTLHVDLWDFFHLEPGCYRAQAVFCAYPNTNFRTPNEPILNPLEFFSEWIEIEITASPQE